MSKIIMGIQLEERHESATDVQGLLTRYGCNIKTRVGVHQTSEDSCSEQGIILLEFMNNSDKEVHEMEAELSKIDHVTVKKMVF